MWILLALAGLMSMVSGIHEMFSNATIDKVVGFTLSFCGLVLTCIAVVILLLIAGHH